MALPDEPPTDLQDPDVLYSHRCSDLNYLQNIYLHTNTC